MKLIVILAALAVYSVHAKRTDDPNAFKIQRHLLLDILTHPLQDGHYHLIRPVLKQFLKNLKTLKISRIKNRLIRALEAKAELATKLAEKVSNYFKANYIMKPAIYSPIMKIILALTPDKGKI